MEAENRQKHLERLARVRENQRQSRARKQEYVRELEQRLASFKVEAQRKDIQHRLASQKIEAENRHLRTLLGSLGISAELVQQYLQLADQGTVLNRKVAIPAMQRPAELPPIPPSSGTGSPQSSSTRASAPTACSTATERSPSEEASRTPTTCAPLACAPTTCAPTTCAPTTCAPVQAETEGPQQRQKPKHAEPALCQCPPGNPGMDEGNGDVLNTTLCAMAEELISQYNTSGIDIDEIRQRLWAGFRANSTGDGCRVENQVLFQVLDEISNSI
ncbi:uncharacterized protein N7482_008398 [Penicillium canariense]|uniref:BZIP domain-containing protein n=1 Tax=Penicillium canariense TaxID=189055 RepID=A0A9W9HT56_9EURO|nr:uncharacterized protein N7482_008398 [Penicillium canariense]KAJ5157298.1 hypothetical protein N7482_008398 [Penicillium canariense]